MNTKPHGNTPIEGKPFVEDKNYYGCYYDNKVGLNLEWDGHHVCTGFHSYIVASTLLHSLLDASPRLLFKRINDLFFLQFCKWPSFGFTASYYSSYILLTSAHCTPLEHFLTFEQWLNFTLNSPSQNRSAGTRRAARQRWTELKLLWSTEDSWADRKACLMSRSSSTLPSVSSIHFHSTTAWQSAAWRNV